MMENVLDFYDCIWFLALSIASLLSSGLNLISSVTKVIIELLSHYLTISLTISLIHSFIHYLTHYLIISLTISLSHYLTISLKLTHSLIGNIFQELHRLPPSIQNDKKAAVIIPAVFLKQKNEILNKCNSLQSCEKEYKHLFFLSSNRSMKYIPNNRKQLLSCVRKHSCSFKKESAHSHVVVL